MSQFDTVISKFAELKISAKEEGYNCRWFEPHDRDAIFFVFGKNYKTKDGGTTPLELFFPISGKDIMTFGLQLDYMIEERFKFKKNEYECKWAEHLEKDQENATSPQE